MADESVIFAKAQRQEFLSELIAGVKPDKKRKAIVFMAGTPGAGKAEVAAGLRDVLDNVCIIDADSYRQYFLGYNGHNSSDFQRGSACTQSALHQCVLCFEKK
ncbi:zeta toxin family protein [Lactiplantibacillus daowaiensis]|uniref:UDP-N-acetylglucosamine kinase n=1 Tax=Lactiplantibacillus daowaiensis TaxID=2559918 RepID=A0ABW1S2I8_9LACO